MNMRFYVLCLMMLFTGHTTYNMLAPILAGQTGALAVRGAGICVTAAPRVDMVSIDGGNRRVCSQLFKRTLPLKGPWSLRMEEMLGVVVRPSNRTVNTNLSCHSGQFLLSEPDKLYPEGTEYGKSGRQMPLDKLPKGSWKVVRGWQDHGIQQGDYGNKVHVCKRFLKNSNGQDYQQVAKHVIDEITIDGKPDNLNKRGFDYELFCAGQKVNVEFESCQTVDPEEENDICPYVQESFRYTAQNNPERAKYSSLDDLIKAGRADDHLVSLAIERDDMEALEKLLKAIGARREPSMSEDYVKKDSARQVHHYYGGREKNTHNLLAEAMLSVHLGHTNYAPTAQSKLQSMLKYDTKEPRFKEAVDYLLKHGNLSMHMQLKGAQAIDNEQMVSEVYKKIASRLFAGVAVGAFTGAAKLAYDYMNQQEDQVVKPDAL